MGNTTAGFGYDDVVAVDYQSNNHWQLTVGTKKEEKEPRDKVSIFKFPKSQAAKLPLATKNVQKLRTMRHPFILSFVESMEIDDGLVLVTEQIVPLEQWIQSNASIGKRSEEQQQAIQLALTWGIKCLLSALDFLHSKCNVIHGNLGTHAIFVTSSGDWKLGCFELACNPTKEDDLFDFARNQNILAKRYFSPERSAMDQKDILNSNKITTLPNYMDIYSLGQCVEYVFDSLALEVPKGLTKYLSMMQADEPKRRPKAGQLHSSAFFNSANIKMLENINELSVKSTKEVADLLTQLEPKLAELSDAICIFKVLPSVAQILQMAVNEFANRDARELCRQNIQLAINLLTRMATLGKLDEKAFVHKCLPVVTQLFTMTDRSIRTSMLLALKTLGELVPVAAINKTIFDNIISGFSDSNAKMRENTLMSLIYIVDKLEGNQLQEKLVRCITNLQSDVEAGIRTNATIFLGKIAVKLKEPVRARVLCNAFTKAMKDNFTHCRIAGLKTSQACIKLLDVPQVAGKLVPTASVLLLDKNADIRVLALSLIEASLVVLRHHHQTLLDSKTATASTNNSSAEGSAASSGGAGADAWSSWSVLQGLSKTIETTVNVSPAPKAALAPLGAASSAINNSISSSSAMFNTKPSSMARDASDTLDGNSWDTGGSERSNDSVGSHLNANGRSLHHNTNSNSNHNTSYSNKGVADFDAFDADSVEDNKDRVEEGSGWGADNWGDDLNFDSDTEAKPVTLTKPASKKNVLQASPTVGSSRKAGTGAGIASNSATRKLKDSNDADEVQIDIDFDDDDDDDALFNDISAAKSTAPVTSRQQQSAAMQPTFQQQQQRLPTRKPSKDSNDVDDALAGLSLSSTSSHSSPRSSAASKPTPVVGIGSVNDSHTLGLPASKPKPATSIPTSGSIGSIKSLSLAKKPAVDKVGAIASASKKKPPPVVKKLKVEDDNDDWGDF